MTPRPQKHDTVEVVGDHPMAGRLGEVVEVQRATSMLHKPACSVRIGSVRWAIPDEKLRVVADPPIVILDDPGVEGPEGWTEGEVQYWDPEKAPQGVRAGPRWHPLRRFPR